MIYQWFDEYQGYKDFLQLKYAFFKVLLSYISHNLGTDSPCCKAQQMF